MLGFVYHDIERQLIVSTNSIRLLNTPCASPRTAFSTALDKAGRIVNGIEGLLEFMIASICEFGGSDRFCGMR